MLVISGHFDGGTEFYTDRLDAREFLPVDEMERVVVQRLVPGLFSQLKEVYLFGCNTLNAEAMRSASAEIARSLVRSGHSPADAERLVAAAERAPRREQSRSHAADLQGRAGASTAFRRRRRSGAPRGPLLERYFQSASGGEVGERPRERASSSGLFAPSSA